jgi:DNA-binding MarR family transcriptional regulator
VETDAGLTSSELAPDLRLDTLPTELRVVLGRLIRRLRSEHRFPLTQASVLGYLDRDGPLSIGELAALESVRPQSMSQTVGELEAEGLIERRQDERDGRRMQIALTPSGRAALEIDRAAREGWLGHEIAGFTVEEQELLREAVALLNRLANAS